MLSAFTDDEVERLKSYTAPGKATLFTGKLYFPFLTCEVKCGENGLNIADRQNAHSASMAVDAIVQLYRDRAVSRAEELHRKILVFSVSHDHTMVNIYGYYALIEGDKTTFYRHLIRSFNFTDLDGKDRDLAYKFTRKVYDTFVPTHLERIQSAVAQLPDPKSDSFISIASTENDSELADSQETMTNAPSSRDTAGFKKPKLPPKVMLQQENNRLKQEKQELMDLLKQQTPSNASTSESMLLQEIDRLKEQAASSNAPLMASNAQLMDLLKQQTLSNTSTSESMLQQKVERQRQQLTERDERLAQEKAESQRRHTELMEQLKESQQRLAQEKEESQRRLAQEKEESQRRHTELMKQNKELMDQLKELIGISKGQTTQSG